MSEPRAPEGESPARMKAVLLAAAAVAFAAGPLAFPFQGFDPALFPVPQDDPPVQPAGWAFAIWGPIYLALLVHAFWGLLRRADDPGWDAPRLPLGLSLVVGAAWLGVAQISALWATLLIWGMLAGAVLALLRLPASGERWLRQAPLAVYAGWLTAASSVALGLVGAGWGIGPGQAGWAVIAVALALAIGASVQLRRPQAPEYGLTICWALVAIAAANAGERMGLALLAAAGAAAIAALALRPLLRRGA